MSAAARGYWPSRWRGWAAEVTGIDAAAENYRRGPRAHAEGQRRPEIDYRVGGTEALGGSFDLTNTRSYV